MKNRYRVRMTRDCTQSVDIIVTAESIDDAEHRAWTEARNNFDLPWQDDDYVGKPYCPDLDDISIVPDGQPVSDGCYELREE